MNWCDKLASTPTVGVKFDDHFASSSRILDSLSPFLNRLVKEEKPTFSLTKHEAFEVSFNTDDGFEYAFDHSRVSVGFSHRMKVKPVSGRPPTVEMLSSALPFTELLPNVCEKLLYATSLVLDPQKRPLKRIGIVSTTVVAEDELPPGIKRLIYYLGRPWEHGIDSYNCQFVTTLNKNPKHTDRCIHNITKSEKDEEGLITVRFDCQRIFTDTRMMTLNSLEKEIESSKSFALGYLETLAIGDIFDEELISKNS
jgi:hypothetical protein